MRNLVFRFLLASILLVSSFITISQPSLSPYDLHPPIDGKLNLSGLFGEVRYGSFHGGLDFRTGGKTGQRLYASDNGFVSRIRSGGTGFGKAIYIQHPNGLTTVYGHLERFMPELEKYVKEQQYKREKFEVDLYLTGNEFPIKRGQFIGLSGNTGMSAGPHLHYEVRLTPNQKPLNPIFSNFAIVDTMSPNIYSVWLYNLDSSVFLNSINSRTELKVQKKGSSYFVEDTINFEGVAGLGVETYDFVNSASLPGGVYSIKMYINSSLRYHYTADEYLFSDTRYSNSHIDYALRIQTAKRVHKLFKDPNNLLDLYKVMIDYGRIAPRTDSVFNVKILLEDAKRNSAELLMVLNGKPEVANFDVPVSNSWDSLNIWYFFKENSYNSHDYRVVMPAGGLYNNIVFEASASPTDRTKFSPLVKIHSNETPVHKHFTLAIRADSLPERLREKALVAHLNAKGALESAGGKFIDGWVETKVNFFGNFFITTDVTPPKITPLNITKNKDMSKEKTIRFKVEDNLSGIASIKGYIDGKWVLFEHDPKNKLVFYEFDAARLARGTEKKLSFMVIDNKDNKSEYVCAFTW